MKNNITDLAAEFSGVEEADSDLLKKISNAANSLSEAEKEIAKIEQELKEVNEKKRKIEYETLPDLMAEADVKEFKLANGSKITIKDVVKASIPSLLSLDNIKDPSEREIKAKSIEEAFNWLRERGASALIKSKIVADLGKGEDLEKINTIMDTIRKLGFEAQRDSAVHPMTLSSYVKELLSVGTDIPDSINCFVGKQAKVTEIKNKKGA